MPFAEDGLSPRDSPNATRELPFRIKPDGDDWKLIAGEQVLLDGERQGPFGRQMAAVGIASPPQLKSGAVISSRRAQMPLYVFLEAPPKRHPAIEARIAEHDRDEDWLVYADWLQQEGDPLGRQLMRTHAISVGCARPNFLMVRRLNVEWRYCFWRSAALEPIFGHRYAVEDLTLLLALVSSPQARLMRSLRVNLTEICETAPQAEQLATALIQTALPRSLRHLELGPVNHGFPHAALKRLLPRWDGEPIAHRSATPTGLPSVGRWLAVEAIRDGGSMTATFEAQNGGRFMLHARIRNPGTPSDGYEAPRLFDLDPTRRPPDRDGRFHGEFSGPSVPVTWVEARQLTEGIGVLTSTLQHRWELDWLAQLERIIARDGEPLRAPTTSSARRTA